MAQDNQSQEQNNSLNKAVEHNATPDSNTDEHRAQDRQNQQNTMASTTATGSDAAEQNDQVNGPSNEQGGDNAEDAGGQPTAETSGPENSGESQGRSADNGQGQQSGEQPQEDGNTDGGGSPQAVGGGAQRSAQSEQQQAPNRPEPNAQEQGQGAGGSGGQTSGQGASQSTYDTETTSETFQVDVADATSKEMVVDGDFDTETNSETFEIQVDNVNDEVVIDDQQLPSFEANEDGQIVVTEAQLLSNASDVDGDDLSVLNLSIANASFEPQVDPETGERSFVITPDDDVNGELEISFDVTDGQGSEVASSAVLNVVAVNDEVEIDTNSPLVFESQEDNQILITEAQFLANASDVDGDDLSLSNLQIEDATFTTQIDDETGEKSFLITPNQDVNGDLEITFDVSDGQGSVVPSRATLQVEAVNDAVIASDDGASSGPTVATFSATPDNAQQASVIQVDEDGELVLRPEDLLANDTDADGDTLTITEVSATADTHGTVELDESGNVVFTPDADYNGPASFEYTVTDGNGTFDTATVSVDVVSVNDLVVATDDSRLNGLEPQIRLDVEPEYGSVQYLDSEGEWAEMEVGREYPADTQMLYVPDTDSIQAGTRDIQVGSFDSDTSTTIFDGTARVEDWGDVDGDTAIYQEDGVTVTTQVNSGQLAAWNGSGSHVGAGIGNESREGLDTNEMLTVTIEGEEVNQITFQLDGLGSYFDETHSHATEVIIEAYDEQGNLIDSQGGYRESGEYQDTYVFTTDTPVHHFTLGTTGSDGTYVVQNMTISRTLPEELQVTTIQADGSEVSNSLQLALNHNTAGENIDITEQLIEVNGEIESRPIEVQEDGQLVISPSDLLANDTDADGDILTITEVSVTSDTHGTVELDESGNVVFTPDADYHGPASFEYTVTDGNGSFDTATVSVDVTPQNDAAVVEKTNIDGTEDTAITFTQEMLLQNASDVDSDTLTAINLDIDPQYGELKDNGDGSFTFTPKDDFNGEVPFTFEVDDNDGAVTPASGTLDVAAVNDVPVFAETSYTIAEDGSITITEASLLANVTDVDNDDLSVTNISVEGNGTVTRDDETGDWTYTPDADYSGDAALKITVNDTKVDAIFTAPVTITPDADEPSLTVSLTDMSLIDFGLGHDTALTGWHTDNHNNHIEIHQDYVYGVGDNRGGVIELEANRGDESNLYTHLDVKAGEVVTLEFDMSARKGWEGEDSQVDIYFEGQLIDSLAPEQIGWNHYSYQFTATTDNPKLEFDSPDDNSLGGILDSITVVKEVTEDLPTPLNINAALNDTDGSESLQSLVVDDLPDGAILSDGDNTFIADGEDDSVDINGWDLSQLTFQGGENFHGPVSLKVTATSIEQATADDDTPETASTTASLDFNVVPVNDAVDIDGDSPLQFNTDEDTSIVITEAALLRNASDIDGDDLSVVNLSIADATFTTVVDPETGEKSYVVTPDQDVNGDLAISFDVTDGEGSQVASGATLQVEAVADAPDLNVTDGDGNAVAEEGIDTDPDDVIELNIAASLTDQDLSETLGVTIDGVPEGGVIKYDGQAVLDAQDNGLTSYADTEVTVTFAGEGAGFKNSVGYYRIDEEGNISDVELVYENASQVRGGGDLLPGQSSFSFELEQGESFNIFVIPNGFNKNDFDGMGEGTFEFRDQEGNPASMSSTDPQLVFIGDDGSETIIRSQFGDAIFHGGSSENLNQDNFQHTHTTLNDDGQIVYGIEDWLGGGDRDYDDFMFTIDMGEENSNIFRGEILSDGETPIVLPTVAIEGTIQLQLPEDYNDEFDLVVEATATERSNNDEATTTQTIHVDAREFAPEVTGPATASTDEDTTITLTQDDLLANASDADGDALVAQNVTTTHPDVRVIDNGNGTFEITPPQDFHGDIALSFEVTDGEFTTPTQMMLTVDPVNDTVIAQDDSSLPGDGGPAIASLGAPSAVGINAIEVEEDGQLVISPSDLLANDTDVDGDILTLTEVSATADTHGTVELDENGNVVFTPDADYHGPASFEYTVTDGNGSFDTATVSVDVTPQNDAAVVEKTNIDGTEDTAITFTQEMLLQNATDVDSDTLTAINLDIDPQYGDLKDNGDGSFTFTPKDDFNGEVPFTFEVDDNDGAVTPASGTLDVAAVNDVPVFAETSYTIAEDGSITITEASLLANVTDVDQDDLSVTNISVEGNGTVTRDDETGNWTYTPDADYSGDAALKITVNDTKVDAIFTAPVTITPEADEPSLTVSLTDMSLIDFGLGHDTALTGWHTDNQNNHIEIHQDYVYGVGDNRGGVIELEANRGDESNLYTNLDVKAGEVVTLEFDMSARKNHEGEDSQIDIYFEGQLIDSLAPEDIGWNHYSYQFTATTDNPKLEFDSPDDNSLGGLLDSITVVKEVTEDIPTPLNINAALNDTDGSESLQSLVVDDLPDGAILSDGDNSFIADGESDSVDINGWDLSQLTFQGGENFHGPVSLKVTATSIEQATADDDTPETASTTASLDFNVVPVNDAVVIDGDSPLQFNTDEDTSIVITEAALLRNASDVDGDDLSVVNLSIADATFTTVVDPETGEKSYVVTPNQDVNGDLAVSFDVTDGEGSQVASGATLQVAAVNDGPEVSGNLEYTIDEDGTITLTQEQLLANASDVDGDKLTADNLQLDGEGKVERNDDGSYTITPDENFNGELNLTFEVTDGLETVATGLDLTVNAVNDEVVAADDSRMSAQEPQIRLDAEPEHGTVQCMNAEGEWEDMVVGREYPADAQVQFVPDTDDVQSGTRDIMVGSFDSDTSTTVFDGTASVDDWGTVDGNKAVYQEDGVTITTEVSKGDLAAWNGAGSHKGAGIGNDSKNGLSGDEYLTVTVEGEDVNQITFQLDGLGGYFDESSSKATEVIIQAFDAEGNLIDSQGGFRESGEYQDTYAFTTDVPVHHFTLGTEGGNGTYVVQNMTVSRTMSDEIQMTTIQADGSEDTNTLVLDLNHNKADEAMDVTEQLVEVQQGITSRAIEVEEDGQLVIAPADLLANDTDADGDVLTITAVEATDDTHGKVELDEDGNVVFTPAPDYNGPASFTYTVTDGNGSFDTATVSVDVKPVEDLPQAPTLDLDVNEDQVLVIDPAFILAQATDADGDKLSLESLSLKQPPTGNLQLQQDGMYHLITPPDFNGLIELDYAISDGDDVVDGSLKVDVLPVNDAPFNGGNAHLTTYEDGAFTFRAEDMLDLFGDVDGDDLVVSKVITVEGEDAGDVEQNEDGSWTFTPADDYSGTAELQVEVSDPSGATTVMDVPVYIRPVADGAVITTDHDGPLVFDEDTTGLLGLNVDMLDASEQLSNLVITGFPVGFVVSDGENMFTVTEPGQVIDVTTWSFEDLSLTPPNDFSGSFFITVSATTADYGDETSNALPEPTQAYTDFDIAQGETLVLTLDDLLDMAEGLETTDTDSVQGVHLIDRSQGELVDNGDGTWSFTPAVDAQGPVDFAYQVNQGGDLVDVQSSIAVTESTEQAEDVNSAPVVDNIATTELGAGNELIFTDTDMLGQLSDADNDQLSIESVQLIGGQGVLETNSEGQYTFTPAQGFAGQAQIAFVATDGNSSIQSHFNVAVAEPEPSEFMLDEMGSLTLTPEELLGALNLSDESAITAVDYHGDQGTLIQDGDEWVFWSDDDFAGQLPLEVTSSDGETTAVHQLSLDVDEYQDPDSEPAMAESEQGDRQDVDTQTATVDQSDDSQQEGEEADSDITAAPGNTVQLDIPDEVMGDSDVFQVEIDGLPEGATLPDALLNNDGSYTVTGDLSKPVAMNLSDDFEGEATITFEGQTDMGEAVEGASGSVTIEVDDDYAMQGNQGANNNQPAMQDEGGQNGDWTQGDNSNQGVDVMDDSSSYDNDSSGSQQDDSPVMDENV